MDGRLENLSWQGDPEKATTPAPHTAFNTWDVYGLIQDISSAYRKQKQTQIEFALEYNNVHSKILLPIYLDWTMSMLSDSWAHDPDQTIDR